MEPRLNRMWHGPAAEAYCLLPYQVASWSIPTIWPQYSDVTDRTGQTDRQWYDSI